MTTELDSFSRNCIQRGGVQTILDPRPHCCLPVHFAYAPCCPISLDNSEGPPLKVNGTDFYAIHILFRDVII